MGYRGNLYERKSCKNENPGLNRDFLPTKKITNKLSEITSEIITLKYPGVPVICLRQYRKLHYRVSFILIVQI